MGISTTKRRPLKAHARVKSLAVTDNYGYRARFALVCVGLRVLTGGLLKSAAIVE